MGLQSRRPILSRKGRCPEIPSKDPRKTSKPSEKDNNTSQECNNKHYLNHNRRKADITDPA